MKFSQLASHIAKIESKRREVAIGNIREMLSIVCEVLAREVDFPENIKTANELIRVGRKRLNRKKSK